MDTQNLSAPACAQPLNPRGITHINTKHTAGFTVVGNHLTQHRRLSLIAIGLACHIQSLPSGARVDIKTLAARFPEGETRIAAALRELEAHGYLARIRERLPSGRIVTYTVSYNQPLATQAPHRPRRTPPHSSPLNQNRHGNQNPLPSPNQHPSLPNPNSPNPKLQTSTSTAPPPPSSPRSTTTTPASSSPNATSAVSPRPSAPGSNAGSPPRPYAVH